MNILKKIDWDILNTYIDSGLIIANKHPEFDMWILNYSPKVQAKRIWDEYTVSCRGLVIDIDGKILARPFQKFMNYEEHDPNDIDMSIPFDIYEKRDGSLIIGFYYAPRMSWIVASRGSFISEQSIEAKKIINVEAYDVLDKNYTYLWEIHYPENRVVVDYGNLRNLVLLTSIDTSSGYEMNYDDLITLYSKYFEIVKKYNLKNITDLLDLKKLEEDNKEGFVVKFANNFRVKVKFSEYVRLHGVLTNVSNLTIWEHLMNNYNFDLLLDRVPDEFYGWLKRTTKSLQVNYNETERIALKEFLRIYHVNNVTDRREFAMEASKTECRSILFKLYDKKPYSDIIWKSVKPKFSKPFKDGYEYVE